MSRTERLKQWIEGLDEQTKSSILLDTVNYLIDTQDVSFYESSDFPRWDGNGERLDGVEDLYDEDED